MLKVKAQTNQIKIEFLGNCGLYMTDGDLHLYTDFPYKSGAFNYMEYNEAELDRIQENAIFLFTHKHADHYSKRNLKEVLKTKNGQAYGVSNIKELEQLNEQVPDFEIQAFKTKHKVFGISFRHYSYLITWHGKRIFLSGDTTEPQTIATMSNLDWAFIPDWMLHYAKEEGVTIDSEMIGIYHLYPDETEKAKENWQKTDNILPLTEPNEINLINY